MSRTITALALAIAVAVPSAGAIAAPCWAPPVAGWVTDPFRAPPCRYCSGNRGLEYRTGSAAVVRSVAAGTVTFSGIVAGTRYVVVQLANRWLITYGKLAATNVARGDIVASRTIVGRAAGELFLGLRIQGVYSDPAPYIGQRVGRPRLVPIDGRAPRPSRDVRWRCTSQPRR